MVSKIEDSYPLSPIQEGMLFQSLNRPRSGVEIWQVVFTLREEVDSPALRQAMEWVINRHSALRTAFRWQGVDRAVQEVHGRVRLPFKEQDWREVPEDDQRQRLEDYLQRDRQRGFRLNRPPLLRFMLFHFGPAHYQLVLTIHHSIIDGRSVPMLFNGIFDTAAAISAGKSVDAPPAPSFRVYVDHLERVGLEKAQAFWTETLAGFKTPTPLLDDGAGDDDDQVVGSADMSGHLELDLPLSSEVSAGLVALAKRHQVSLNTVVQAAWAIYLGRTCDSDDVVFGAIKSCRASLPEGPELVGPMINTVAVRARVAPDTGIVPLLRQLREHWTALREHEHAPLSKVQEWSETPSGSPLLESLMLFERYQWTTDLSALLGPTWSGRSVDLRRQPDYPLTVYVFGGERLLIKMIYDRSRFTAAGIERRLHHLSHLLAAMAQDDSRTIGELEMLSEAEHRQVTEEWARGPAGPEASSRIDQLIARQAAETPGQPAIAFEDEVTTYGDLEQQTERLARRLVAAGAGAGTRIGLLIERSPDTLAAMLAALRTGGAYVPLDLTEPAERIAAFVRDLDIRMFVTRERWAERLPALELPVIEIDGESETADGWQPAAVDLDAPALVLPDRAADGRGVAVSHRALARLSHWARETFDDGELGGCLASSPITMAASVFELLVPLCWGGKVLLAGRRPSGDAVLVHSVPTAVAELLRLDALPPSVRTVVVSGEAPNEDLVEHLFEVPSVERLVVLYGSAENPCSATAERRRESPDAGLRPASDTRILLLDSRRRPVPVGAPGQLHLELPETERLATGDRARWLPDGGFELLGRRDRRVLIQGIPVEPEEVEAVLAGHPQVEDVAVMAREDEPGKRKLVAYIVGSVAEKELDAFIESRLPYHLRPERMPLGLLPRTADGEIDFAVLPSPEIVRTEAAAYTAPSSSMERTIAGIWSEILKVDDIGVNDNFFDLGGHSLALVRAYERVSEALEMDLSHIDLFEYPTISALARRLSGGEREAIGRDEILARAAAQRRARAAKSARRA